MDTRQIFLTFLQELEELLTDMESTLLEIETRGADREGMNKLFRAAHTVKGSGGLFGLDAIVGFTHVMETLLDILRENPERTDRVIISLLLRCCDHLGQLRQVIQVDQGTLALTPALKQTSDALLGDLAAVIETVQRGGSGASATPATTLSVPTDAVVSSEADAAQWHIGVRFDAGLFLSGFNPLKFIELLDDLFEASAVRLIVGPLPEWSVFDPEQCYLGLEYRGIGETTLAAIEDVFLFVLDEITLWTASAALGGIDPESRLAGLPEAQRTRVSGAWSEIETELAPIYRERSHALSSPSVASAAPSDLAPPRDAQVSPAAPAVAATTANAANAAAKNIRVSADKLDQMKWPRSSRPHRRAISRSACRSPDAPAFSRCWPRASTLSWIPRNRA